MKVFVFECADPASPVRAIARIWCAGVGRGGATIMDWHPVLIPGASAEAVRDKAETWWSAQVEAERAKTRKAKGGPSPAVLTPAADEIEAEAI